MKRIVTLVAIVAALCSFTMTGLKPVDKDGAVTFVIKNFGINTKGSLSGLKGTLKWDAANPAASQISATVDVKTISTNIESRDNHLKEDSYFDVAKYPTISFNSTAVSANSITGNLTIKGTTKSITFPISVTPSGKGYLFHGEFTINRRDFGVGGGSMVLGEDVKVTLNVQADPA